MTHARVSRRRYNLPDQLATILMMFCLLEFSDARPAIVQLGLTSISLYRCMAMETTWFDLLEVALLSQWQMLWSIAPTWQPLHHRSLFNPNPSPLPWPVCRRSGSFDPSAQPAPCSSSPSGTCSRHDDGWCDRGPGAWAQFTRHAMTCCHNMTWCDMTWRNMTWHDMTTC